MDTRQTTPDLLHRALDGDAESWTLLVKAHTPLLLNVALRAGLGREDAEDVAQSVWVELLHRGHTIRDGQALPRWLAVLAHRFAVRRRQRDAAAVHPQARQNGFVLIVRTTNATLLDLVSFGPGRDENHAHG